MSNEESSVAAVLRSLDVDPDAQLVHEPAPLGMRRVRPMTPEQIAERAERLAAQRESEGRRAQALRAADLKRGRQIRGMG